MSARHGQRHEAIQNEAGGHSTQVNGNVYYRFDSGQLYLIFSTLKNSQHRLIPNSGPILLHVHLHLEQTPFEYLRGTHHRPNSPHDGPTGQNRQYHGREGRDSNAYVPYRSANQPSEPTHTERTGQEDSKKDNVDDCLGDNRVGEHSRVQRLWISLQACPYKTFAIFSAFVVGFSITAFAWVAYERILPCIPRFRGKPSTFSGNLAKLIALRRS